MTGRTYVNLNWERAANGALSPYLSIARPDHPVERIPITTVDVARLLADGAMLWAVVEPMRQGSMQNLHNAAEPDHFVDANKMAAPDLSEGRPRYNPSASDDTQVAPHFIGAWGE